MSKQDTVERLAGGIAHDFDLLLSAIVGHADNLSDYLSPGDPRAIQVAAIRQAAERACGLTQQLLAFSRTQALQPTEVALNPAIDRLRYMLQRVVGSRIAIETQLAADAWDVRADPEQLQQILHNLAVNGRDAMPDGGTLVIATANVSVGRGGSRAPELEPGDYVALSVADSGGVIAASAQPHLFEPFCDAPQGQRATGLGLAIVHGVVTQSGGQITVESPVGDAGRGTRFTIFLPATRPQAGAASADRDVPKTVLVAGDDHTVQALIAKVLRRRGYRVLNAADGWQALRAAADHDAPIDLLITAAGANGAAMADALREQRPDTRVLFVAASTAEPVSRAAADVLMQPFTPDALVRRVRGMIEGSAV